MNICVYHANCSDGFGAATVVKKAIPDCEFHAGVYNEPPPDVTGKKVWLVDFSYPRKVVEKLLETATSVTIIDHHKSAALDLVGLSHPNLIQYFSMNYSGAVLTWNYFFPDQPVPILLQHIQDRDLWRHEMPMTNEIISALFSLPQSFELWFSFYHDVSQLIAEGIPITRARNMSIKKKLEEPPQKMVIGGYTVPVMNCSASIASEVAGSLARDYPFAATYHDTANHRVFSLRSTKTGKDVGEMAKALYGGGGHKHAAGFRINLSIGIPVIESTEV